MVDIANGTTGMWFSGYNLPNPPPKSSMERNLIIGDGTSAGSWHSATTRVNLDASSSELATPKAEND